MNLEQIIDRNILIKPKVKLLQIELIDNELQQIHQKGLTFSDFNLQSINFSLEKHLLLPLDVNIKRRTLADSSILDSYLIYLSYIYNYNFWALYRTNFKLFYKTILKLNIPKEIKDNLYTLLKTFEVPYFSQYLETFNNAEFREELRLIRRKLPTNVK